MKPLSERIKLGLEKMHASKPIAFTRTMTFEEGKNNLVKISSGNPNIFSNPAAPNPDAWVDDFQFPLLGFSN